MTLNELKTQLELINASNAPDDSKVCVRVYGKDYEISQVQVVTTIVKDDEWAFSEDTRVVFTLKD